MSGPTVLMAGGGTGGHVFPMVAVAHALRQLRSDIRPVFIGTERGMEKTFVPAQGFELQFLEVLPIRGRGPLGALRGAARACALLPESRALILRENPRAVFSIGGYAAGPVSLAARTLGVPVALMEPNSVIGLANLLIAPFVERAYTAFELSERHFAPSRVLRTGVPLRPGFVPRAERSRELVPKVLVLGGSQGAKSLNEILPAALARLPFPVEVVHQCGQANVEEVQKRYSELDLRQVEVTPFIFDMPSALGDADLVVGRAGAGAVSEITAVGRPSLLIPYPYASGDHQRLNAESLEAKGAAVCVTNKEATVERIFAELAALLGDRARLSTMTASARSLGRPAAALAVARDFLSLAGIECDAQSGAGTGREVHRAEVLGEVA